jgi:LysR family nitrogen assimilation transcriptional regulator
VDRLRSAISLRQLHYLVAVADAGSFRAAADQTHVAQPALSRQIAMLEMHVGLLLMDRSRKGVTLTEGGVRLYNLARRMLERLGSIELELRASEKQPAGVVTVALPTSVASMLVPRVVRELELRYPDVILRVVDGLSLENARSLEAALIDFGLVPTADALADVHYEPLVRERLLLVERRSASRPVPATITFGQAARLKLVAPSRSFHTRRLLDAIAHASNLTLNIACEQRSLTTIMSLVRDGLGATIPHSPAAEEFWAPGAVRARRIVRPEITRTMSLARPAERPLSFAAQAVYDVLKRFMIEAVKRGHWQGTLLC